MFGAETQKAHFRRVREDFYSKFLQGKGLDIGFAGYESGTIPITNSIGVDKNYPNYNGTILPFENESQHFVYSSHCLEHIENYKESLVEWLRVLKIGGFLIITVPHKFLYEKKEFPSRFNGDHRRMYTPASLMKEIEESFQPNSYRLVYIKDCAEDFDYSIPPEVHSCGEYQIELVLQKIEIPKWEIK